MTQAIRPVIDPGRFAQATAVKRGVRSMEASIPTLYHQSSIDCERPNVFLTHSRRSPSPEVQYYFPLELRKLWSSSKIYEDRKIETRAKEAWEISSKRGDKKKTKKNNECVDIRNLFTLFVRLPQFQQPRTYPRWAPCKNKPIINVGICLGHRYACICILICHVTEST